MKVARTVLGRGGDGNISFLFDLINVVNLYLNDKDDTPEALFTWLLNGIMEKKR